MVKSQTLKWKVITIRARKGVYVEQVMKLTNGLYYIDFSLLNIDGSTRLNLQDYGRFDRLLKYEDVNDQMFKTLLACVCELADKLVTVEDDTVITVLQ